VLDHVVRQFPNGTGQPSGHGISKANLARRNLGPFHKGGPGRYGTEIQRNRDGVRVDRLQAEVGVSGRLAIQQLGDVLYDGRIGVLAERWKFGPIVAAEKFVLDD
jgi:hypothetical protein